MDNKQREEITFDVSVENYTVSDELNRNEQIDRAKLEAYESHKKKLNDSKKKAKKKNKKKRGIKIIAALLVIAIIVSSPFAWLYYKYTRLDNNDYKIDPSLQYNHDPIPEDDDVNQNLLDTEIWHNENVINILLAGCDYGSKKRYYPRSDSIIVASINKKAKTLSFVSLARATYVAIEGFPNFLLNHSHAYGGPELLIKTVENNYKIKIDNFISVDFNGFKALVDILGGVDVTLTSREAAAIEIGSSSGTYHLNGDYALAFARTRSIDDDRTRTGRQREILISLTKKALKLSSVSVYSELLDEILPYVQTDFKYFDILSLISDAVVNNYFSYEIKDTVLPQGTVPHKTVSNMEVLLVDWNSIKKEIHSFLYEGLEKEVADTLSKESKWGKNK